MKLGVVPDIERAPDSPDTALHIAPRIGAQTRGKGHLYLLITSRVPGARAREATRLVADSIRSEYYYDESAVRRRTVQDQPCAGGRRPRSESDFDLRF
jgi:hypothetical protein